VIAAIDLDEGLAALAAAGIALHEDARGRLDAYLALLAKWNRTYNLTAIRDPERMITHHVLDALAVLPYLPERAHVRVLDVGSGAGVPGLPLAIAQPGWNVVLLDSNHKKGAFLRQAAIEIGLSSVEVTTARIENYVPAAPFDVVISRAFSDLATFAQTGARHLAPGGRLFAMKGAYPEEEIAHLPAGMRLIAAPALAVPGLDAQRHLVVMSPTYAREAGA
jgi:16S rRNA (guanine527-N7)-methyltransferase